MRCHDCPNYLKEEHACGLASDGKFYEIDDTNCLLRLLLVWLENNRSDDKPDDPADYWKM